MRTEPILRKAEFDEKVKLYWLLQGAWILFISFAGWVLLPFWFLGLGQWIGQRRYDAMVAELGQRTLHFKQGHLFRVEKTVPLDKIQDVALVDGPLLRKFGLSAVRIETAGGSSQAPDMVLAGVVDAKGFRDAILVQRDVVTDMASGASAGPTGSVEGLLTEIRDILLRLEARPG